MLKRMNLMRLIGAAGLLMLPVLATAAGDICYLRDASSPGPATAYLLCEQGLVYSTHDGGATWATLKTGATGTLHAISFRDDTHGLVVGDGGAILATDDGGKTWQARLNDKKEPVTTEHLLSVFSLGDQAWAGGFDGALLHSADGGRTWTKQESGTTMAVQSLYFMDQNRGWGVGWSGMIMVTSDGGNKWQNITTNAATWSLNSVYFRDARNGWAVGFGGELLRSRDGGLTWEAQKSPVPSNLSSIAFDKSGRIWIAADEQLIMSDDGGEKWRTVDADRNLFLTKVFGSGDTLWALGELGLLKQAPSGLGWKRAETLVPAGTFIPDSLETTASAATGK